MDVLDDLFRGVRAHGSLVGSTTSRAPWSLLFVDGAPLTLCCVLEGGGWLVGEGFAPTHLGAGGTVVLRGPEPFSFVDEPGTDAEPVECGEDCAVPALGGTRHRLGWYDQPAGADGATTMVVGAYPVRSEVGRPLLESLPRLLQVGPGGATDPVRELLALEVAVDAPGQQVVLDRLLDWMLVCAVREHLDRPGHPLPRWYAARADPVVGTALRLMHENPAAPWTVASLAEGAAVSRATLARRFTELVGEPPLTHLTRRRVALAADMLAERGTVTVAEVARAVGYADPFGFSAAFKRVLGVRPSEVRGARRSSRRATHRGLPDPPGTVVG